MRVNDPKDEVVKALKVVPGRLRRIERDPPRLHRSRDQLPDEFACALHATSIASW